MTTTDQYGEKLRAYPPAPVTQSLWQAGCNDARHARPPRWLHIGAGVSNNPTMRGYCNGYAYGLSNPLPFDDPLKSYRRWDPIRAGGCWIESAEACAGLHSKCQDAAGRPECHGTCRLLRVVTP